MFAKKVSIVAGLMLMAMAYSASAFADTAKAAPKGEAPTTQPATPVTPTPSTQPVAAATTTQPAKAETVARDIALGDVYAVRMPGTKPLEISTSADGQSFTNVESVLLSEILASLKKLGSDTRGGFAVNGWDYEALESAHRLLVQDQDLGKLSRDRHIALVFFSYQQGMDVHIRQIVQKGGQVEISFYKVPRGDQEFSAQLAIIPLPQVPAGGLKVVLTGQLDPAYAGTAMAHNDTVFVVTMK